MGKMEQESQRFSRLLLGKTNRQQETYLHQRASLFASAFIGY
jgi:hypothetical protein